MDDIIPFLIVVAISIIGAVSQKKKKQAKGASSVGHPFNKPENNLLNWIEEEFADKEEPFVINRPSTITVAKEEIKTEKPQQEVLAPAPNNKFSLYNGFISSEETERIKQQEGQSVTKASAILDENDITHEGKKEQTETPPPSLDFNLRRAVIFSEILNRRYE